MRTLSQWCRELARLGEPSARLPIRRPLIGRAREEPTTEPALARVLLERVQELGHYSIRERDFVRRWYPHTGERSPTVGRVLGHLRAKPGRRSKCACVLSFVELDA